MSYNASCAPSRLAKPRAKKRVMCASACVCKTPRKSAGCFKLVYFAFTILALEISPFLSKK